MFLRRRTIFHRVNLSKDAPHSFAAHERRETFFALWTTRICVALVALTCMVWAWHPLSGGDDVWAHAAIGRWIVQHHAVPHQTLFQWAQSPVAWVAHSWATQVVFYLLLQYGGVLAIVLFNIALSLLPFVLLWRDWAKRAGQRVGLLAPLLFSIGIYVSTPRFRPRPELFSALAFTLLLIYLSHWPRRRHPSWLWLPPLFCLWANFHGGVALGLVILGATVVGDALQETLQHHQAQEGHSSRWPLLLVVFGACLAAVFVNPYGWEYRAALKPVAGLMFSKIDEWKPYWKTPFLPRTYVIGEMVLWSITLAGWIANPRRRWSHLIWLLIMGAAFLAARRQLWLLALTCLCVSAEGFFNISWEDWRTLLRRKPRQGPLYVKLGQPSPLAQSVQRIWSRPLPFRFSPDLRTRAAQGMVIAALFTWLVRCTPSLAEWRAIGIKEKNLPGGSAQLLRRVQPRRLFNDYEYSSYFQWRFGGHPRLYIDLLNAYPDSVLTDYLTMLAPAGAGHALWVRNHPDAVYIRPHDLKSPLSDITNWLKTNHNWKLVYQGKDGDVWLRRELAAQVARILPPPPRPTAPRPTATPLPTPPVLPVPSTPPTLLATAVPTSSARELPAPPIPQP